MNRRGRSWVDPPRVALAFLSSFWASCFALEKLQGHSAHSSPLSWCHTLFASLLIFFPSSLFVYLVFCFFLPSSLIRFSGSLSHLLLPSSPSFWCLVIESGRCGICFPAPRTVTSNQGRNCLGERLRRVSQLSKAHQRRGGRLPVYTALLLLGGSAEPGQLWPGQAAGSKAQDPTELVSGPASYPWPQAH